MWFDRFSAPDWSALVERCKAGDADAQDELMKRIEPLVKKTVRETLLNDRQVDIADAVQEALLRISVKLNTWGNQRSFLAWVARVARHRTIDLQRRVPEPKFSLCLSRSPIR